MADKAKQQLSPHIDEIERKLMQIVSEKYNAFSHSCNEEMDAILRNREDELARLKESLAAVIDDVQEEVLRSDLEYIVNKQKEF